MARPTKAQMSQSWDSRKPTAFKDLKKRQMEYYMGAKLIEVGVNPKSAIFRWSLETSGNRETWTYSAYWGESKEELLQKERSE
ncbi:hypothetical protein [Oscillatoria acuminata]|uniref:Uncharacterized protein n=1 Tax=Oscillatoria acuminata PCC 6304 TaxID=56110 RepID=K9TS28_9CYAN|nr:hypothetical protein [Oscillatoria acuminata]AFY84981.1 hypothetical protein Oscil6304_5497 [Oscillatoria acuminata PCC 6304]